jgi:hypothetical protein
MFALPEALAITISPVFRPIYEGDIRHICGDAPIREVPIHSEIDKAQMMRICHERLSGHLAFYITWQNAHSHSVLLVTLPGRVRGNSEISTRFLNGVLQILNAVIQKKK